MLSSGGESDSLIGMTLWNSKSIQEPIKLKGLEKQQKVGPEKMGTLHPVYPEKKDRIMLYFPRPTFSEAALLRSLSVVFLEWPLENIKNASRNTFKIIKQHKLKQVVLI